MTGDDTMQSMKFTALMCSRLCHDIIGPVGAINNGIEILADEDSAEMREQAAELLGQSAGEAAAKLQFYRLAFGFAGGMGEDMSVAEARKLTLRLLDYGKVSCDWPEELGRGIGLGKDKVKLICNAVLCIVKSLPRGGRVTVSGAFQPADWTIVLSAKGERARFDDTMVTVLRDGIDEKDLDAHNVQFAYTKALADATGTGIHLEASDNSTVITLAGSVG
jgi:histidine phosphotransferase ChpT